MKNVTILEGINPYSGLYDVTALAFVIGYEPWALSSPATSLDEFIRLENNYNE